MLSRRRLLKAFALSPMNRLVFAAGSSFKPPTEILDVRDAPIRLVFEMMWGTNINFTDDIQGNTTFHLTGKAIVEQDKMTEPYRTNGGDYPPILGWLKEIDNDLTPPGRLLIGFEREGGAFYVSLEETETPMQKTPRTTPPSAFAASSSERIAAIHWYAVSQKIKYPESYKAARRAIWITKSDGKSAARVIREGDHVPNGLTEGERWTVTTIEPTRVVFTTPEGKTTSVALSGMVRK